MAMPGRIFPIVLLLIATTATAQDVRMPGLDFGRFHALVIGNNDYEFLPQLTTAVGDAEAVAGLLEEKYGFKIPEKDIDLLTTTNEIVAYAKSQLSDG